MDVAVPIGLARAEACKRLGRDIGFLANLEVSGTLGKSKVAFAGFEFETRRKGKLEFRANYLVVV